MISRLGLVLIVGLAGCVGPGAQVQGHQVYEHTWNEDQAQLSRRAKFDLSCEQALVLTLLTVSEGLATTVGVEGCGRRATYIRQIDALRNPSTWMLNVEQTNPEQPPK